MGRRQHFEPNPAPETWRNAVLLPRCSARYSLRNRHFLTAVTVGTGRAQSGHLYTSCTRNAIGIFRPGLHDFFEELCLS